MGGKLLAAAAGFAILTSNALGQGISSGFYSARTATTIKCNDTACLDVHRTSALLRVVVPLTSTQVGSMDQSTAVEIDFAGTTLQVTLGEDRRYSPGDRAAVVRTAAVLDGREGAAIVRLQWNDSRMVILVRGAAEDPDVYSRDDLGAPREDEVVNEPVQVALTTTAGTTQYGATLRTNQLFFRVMDRKPNGFSDGTATRKVTMKELVAE